MTGERPAWTLLAVLEWTTRRFTDAGIVPPRLEAQMLLGSVLGLSRVQLYTNHDRPLSEAELAKCRELIRRRLAGEPTAYLVGEQEFWGLSFAVNRDVLIPRRDSETVIEVVLDLIPADERATPRRVVDLCTGSGALAVTLARELTGARVIATDVSPAAAAAARANAERAGVAERVEVRIGDLWHAVAGAALFDVVVSNPPYVRHGDLSGLPVEVRHEPTLALDGGPDGFAVVRPLVAGLAAATAPGAIVALEHGYDQAADVRRMIDATRAFAPAMTRSDLGGNPRVTFARRV